MKVNEKSPPRSFTVKGVTLSHMADVTLGENEFVTFSTPDGGEYDVTAKSWGFYATPSINGRLANFGFKTALVRNPAQMRFVLLVEDGKMDAFDAYCDEQELTIEAWLDEPPSPNDSAT